MANTTYKELADRFFNKVKDNMFVDLDSKISYEIAFSYIPSACSQFQSCTSDLTKRDKDIDELGGFDSELKDSEIEILVNYMVIEYLDSNYLKTAQALKSRLSTSDFHSLQNPQMLAKAMELRTMLKSENDQLAINKSYKNSKLFDLVTNRKKV